LIDEGEISGGTTYILKISLREEGDIASFSNIS
jgi:hypothetical protein